MGSSLLISDRRGTRFRFENGLRDDHTKPNITGNP